MPGKYPTDRALAQDLSALETEQKLTHAQLSKLLSIPGATPTFISKYINDNLDRVVENFEATARDLLVAIRQRIEFGTSIFETSVVTRMASCFHLIRRTGDIGLISSPAGNGKTSAVQAFLKDNPSTIAITATAAARSASKVESLLFSAVDHREWRGQTSRWDLLSGKFKGSSRLIIIDNAHRLDSSGRQWVFDFCDETRTPLAFVGNPEILDRIRANDQQFSRIGIWANYELEQDELPAAATRTAAQYSDPETAEQISDLVAIIASYPGRLRAVEKTVILAQELRSLSPKLRDDPRAAIRAARARLVGDYVLPLDTDESRPASLPHPR